VEREKKWKGDEYKSVSETLKSDLKNLLLDHKRDTFEILQGR